MNNFIRVAAIRSGTGNAACLRHLRYAPSTRNAKRFEIETAIAAPLQFLIEFI